MPASCSLFYRLYISLIYLTDCLVQQLTNEFNFESSSPKASDPVYGVARVRGTGDLSTHQF
jgi:hypothetical protein